jgi:hypothetical protein
MHHVSLLDPGFLSIWNVLVLYLALRRSARCELHHNLNHAVSVMNRFFPTSNPFADESFIDMRGREEVALVKDCAPVIILGVVTQFAILDMAGFPPCIIVKLIGSRICAFLLLSSLPRQ